MLTATTKTHLLDNVALFLLLAMMVVLHQHQVEAAQRLRWLGFKCNFEGGDKYDRFKVKVQGKAEEDKFIWFTEYQEREKMCPKSGRCDLSETVGTEKWDILTTKLSVWAYKPDGSNYFLQKSYKRYDDDGSEKRFTFRLVNNGVCYGTCYFADSNNDSTNILSKMVNPSRDNHGNCCVLGNDGYSAYNNNRRMLRGGNSTDDIIDIIDENDVTETSFADTEEAFGVAVEEE